MEIQKDINKEVLKSDEEKVEDLAKDAEDLEKAVEKDIKDKVEKAEEVNDAKAEPIKSDIVASKKEFKDEQERDKEVVPGLEKAELEEGLTEAKKTLDDVYEDPGLESIWETKWKELVPATGKAKTPIGEVMRCFAKVSHEYFQNGSILGKGYNNKSNYDAANDMDRALQANGLNDNELCKLWDKIWATRSEAAYDHYLAEFYEKFINKYLKNSTVSDKEFKEKQEHEEVEFPEVKKSEFVTEKLKPFTEKLELNEAAETQTEIKELLSDYLLNELEESEFMDNLAWRAEHDVPGYNHDWCAEEASPDYKEKEYEFINELVEDLMANCPLEESLKENKLNESDEEDLRKDANSLSDYLSKNKLYCDLEDYEMYPLGVKVVTFRVEGDWKHDHWYFEDLVEKWAKENGKEIWKTDENIVEEDGSDYYTADHKVYITDKETSDRLNSMRGLFAPKEESLKENLMSNSWGSDFGSDVYNALADIAFKYYKKNINITEDDWAEAIEWFMTHFFEDEQIYEESLKEDLMGTAWGSNFKSDVYNALSKIAFKYYRKDINVTDDDWDEAIEWFMTHFFESDDNPFDESLKEDLNSSDLSKFSGDIYDALAAVGFEYEVKKHINVTEKDWDYALRRFKELFFVPSPEDEESLDESKLGEAVSPDLINAIMWHYGCSKTEASKKAKSMDEERKKLLIKGFKDNAKKSFYSESLKESTEKFIITKVGDNKYALAKGNPLVVNARKIITAKSPEEAKQILVDSGWYSEDELVIESLGESKLDEAIPREVAQALKNSSGQEIKNSGGAYYRIPGSTDSKYSNLDPKTALDNSKVDYANAEFRKISKEEAINVFKNEPQNLLLIVKDYGRNSDKAIWFDENGNRSGRVENVPLDIAPVRRDGTAIRDTKYMTPKQLIGCASACYWTNQREVLRDPDIEKERHQNPESKYYTGDSVSDVIQATSPKYRNNYYGISNSSFRGVEMPSRYSWRPYNEREYQRVKTDLNTWQTRLDSGELSPEDRRYALGKINELEKDFKKLEKDRSKYYNDIKDYKANLKDLTMLKNLKSRELLKRLLDLRDRVNDSDNELRNAEARLATVRSQGGTWSNSYDRRQVARYESQIEELKAQIARYQKYIEDLNAKLNSQQVSEEDAREIANAEADVNRIKSEIEDSKNELNAVLNRARARRQQNTESLEEDLKVTLDFSSFRPWGRAEDTYNRIKDAGKLDEADAILEELYPEGISEDSLNAILAHEPEWLLNELGLADEEEVAMLDLDEE